MELLPVPVVVVVAQTQRVGMGPQAGLLSRIQYMKAAAVEAPLG